MARLRAYPRSRATLPEGVHVFLIDPAPPDAPAEVMAVADMAATEPDLAAAPEAPAVPKPRARRKR